MRVCVRDIIYPKAIRRIRHNNDTMERTIHFFLSLISTRLSSSLVASGADISDSLIIIITTSLGRDPNFSRYIFFSLPSPSYSVLLSYIFLPAGGMKGGALTRPPARLMSRDKGGRAGYRQGLNESRKNEEERQQRCVYIPGGAIATAAQPAPQPQVVGLLPTLARAPRRRGRSVHKGRIIIFSFSKLSCWTVVGAPPFALL